jgi:hypothetical protein
MLIGKIKLCLEMLMDVLYLDGIYFIAGKDLVSPALGRALPKKVARRRLTCVLI